MAPPHPVSSHRLSPQVVLLVLGVLLVIALVVLALLNLAGWL